MWSKTRGPRSFYFHWNAKIRACNNETRETGQNTIAPYKHAQGGTARDTVFFSEFCFFLMLVK